MGFDQFGRWLNDDGHVMKPTNTRIHGAVAGPSGRHYISICFFGPVYEDNDCLRCPSFDRPQQAHNMGFDQFG